MTYYEVHHQRRFDSLNDYVRIGYGTHDLATAAALRVVSGDLVVEVQHGRTLRVCPDPAWLWGWERGNARSYAQRAIDHARKQERGE